MRLGISSGWVGKEEKARQNACENSYVPEFQQDAKETEKRKMQMGLTLVCTTYYALVDRQSPVISTPVAVEPAPPRATLRRATRTRVEAAAGQPH